MALEDSKFYKWHHKHQKFIHGVTGILIVLLLIGLWVMYFSSSKLQREISENCGWGEDDYECYCQKDLALAMKDEAESRGKEITIDDDWIEDDVDN